MLAFCLACLTLHVTPHPTTPPGTAAWTAGELPVVAVAGPSHAAWSTLSPSLHLPSLPPPPPQPNNNNNNNIILSITHNTSLPHHHNIMYMLTNTILTITTIFTTAAATLQLKRWTPPVIHTQPQQIAALTVNVQEEGEVWIL